MKKHINLVFVLAFSCFTFGQNNVFLDREYWKQNPSIAKIKVDINKRNSITELNNNAFDATVYAILENTDNKTIKHLLSYKGNGINKITHDARTYLFWASYKGNLNLVKFLIDNGAKTNLRDSNGNTVMLFTANAGQTNTKIYDILIKNGANPATELTTGGANALHLLAPYIKDVSLIDYFVNKGIDLKSKDRNGNGIFNYAARTVNKKVIQYLIDNNFDIASTNNNGGNAFLFANRGTRNKQNTIEDFNYLESLGVTPNVVTKEGVTPLHYLAYRSKNLDVINYFIKKGVSVNQADKNGNTPFMNAANRNDISVVKELYKHLDDINKINNKKQSALALAVQRNSANVVDFLITKGAKTNLKDLDGNSIAYYLITSFSARNLEGFKEKVALLEQENVSFNEIQSGKNNLFHLAVDKNNIALLDWVNTKEIDINAKNEDGLTPLHKAVMSASNTKLMKHLISLGADTSITTDFEESVYDLASENELLQKNNVDIIFLK